jgi:hypothetical protein
MCLTNRGPSVERTRQEHSKVRTAKPNPPDKTTDNKQQPGRCKDEADTDQVPRTASSCQPLPPAAEFLAEKSIPEECSERKVYNCPPTCALKRGWHIVRSQGVTVRRERALASSHSFGCVRGMASPSSHSAANRVHKLRRICNSALCEFCDLSPIWQRRQIHHRLSRLMLLRFLSSELKECCRSGAHINVKGRDRNDYNSQLLAVISVVPGGVSLNGNQAVYLPF